MGRATGLSRGHVGWLTIAVALTVGMGLVALLNRPPPPDSADALRALPEGSLVYPGSEVISSGGWDASTGAGGRVSAAVWQLLGADAESAAIEAFYAAELAARGWTVDPGSSSGFPATDEMTARVWSKDRVTFRLGIRDPEHWRSDPDLFSRYRSIYDARLIGDRQ